MSNDSNKCLSVFICHSKGDKIFVRSLYERLLSIGCDPWFDEVKLLPGQKWEQEIPKAVKEAHVVIICLSKGAINKRGYIQKEIRLALDVADEVPDGDIFIIPLKIESCDLPERLSKYQWTEIYNDGYDKLINSLVMQAKKLGVAAPNANGGSTDQNTTIKIPTLVAVVTTFIDNYDHLTLPAIVSLLASDRVALVATLSPLIHNTESMDEKEKQYWFDILPYMLESQIGKLLEILGIERRKMIQLEIKYQEEIKSLNEKHLKEWNQLQKKSGTKKIRNKSSNSNINAADVIKMIDDLQLT